MSLVLSGAAVLTMDRQGRVLHEADIRIEGNRIAAVAAADTLACDADETIDCRDMLVMPGLVCGDWTVVADFGSARSAATTSRTACRISGSLV